MATSTPIRSLLTSMRSFSLYALPSTSTLRTVTLPLCLNSLRAFSTTPAPAARQSKVRIDPRITLIRYHLQHSKTPRPLRLSRMRALRHWTIHRAWQLARRKKLEKESLELERMYQSTHSAMEALRNLDPPTEKNAGRLYRVALEKRGLYNHGGIPIEYARLQTDTPGREPWNHKWTR